MQIDACNGVNTDGDIYICNGVNRGGDRCM